MKKLAYLSLLLVAAATSQAQPMQGDLRDAMFAALKSPDGTYKGRLDGATGETLRRELRTQSPVLVSVTTVHRFQNNCARLKAMISAPDMKWLDQKTGQQQSFNYGYLMNLCPDGSPPDDGADGSYPKEGIPIKGAKQ